jgi:acyl carrier protein
MSTEQIRSDEIRATLRALIGKVSGLPEDELDNRATFMEQQLDSLLLVELSEQITETFGVSVPFRRLFDDIPHIDALCAYLVEQSPSAAAERGAAALAPAGRVAPRRTTR